MTFLCCFAFALQETESFSVGDELKKALDALAKSKSYAFESMTARETQGGGDRGGRGGRGGGGPSESKGKYGDGVGVVGEMGDAKVARVGDQVVYTDEEGNWNVYEEPDWEGMREGGGDGGGRRGGSSWRAMRYRGFDAPHKLLDGIGDSLTDVAAAEETDRVKDQECVVVGATMTPEGAKALFDKASGGMMMRFGGRRGGEEGGEAPPEPELSGSMRFWLNDASQIVRIETVLDSKMNWGGNEMTMKTTTTTDFTDIDATEVEIPKRAEDALKEAAEKKAAPPEGE